MNAQVEHTDVAAYALGVLEERDRAAFERHLAGCPACAAELAAMSGLANILTGLGPLDEEEPPVDSVAPPPAVINLLQSRKAAERRRRRGTYLLGAAAAAAMLVTGVAVGSSVTGSDPSGPGDRRHGSPAQQIVADGEPHSATDPQTGVTGTVALQSKAWGTEVGLRLGGVRGPLKCELVAVGRAGQRDVVTGWKVPVKGWGVAGSPDPLITHGGTAMARAELSRFEVRTTDGRTLLTVPV